MRRLNPRMSLSILYTFMCLYGQQPPLQRAMIPGTQISAKCCWARGYSQMYPKGPGGLAERLAFLISCTAHTGFSCFCFPAGALPDVGGGQGTMTTGHGVCRVKSTATQCLWRRKAGLQAAGTRSSLGGFQPKPRPGKMRTQFLFLASENRAHTSLIVEKGFAQLV